MKITILFCNSTSPLVTKEKVLEINWGKVSALAKKKKPFIAWVISQQKKISSLLSILLKKNSDINRLSDETSENNKSITKAAS